MLTVCASGVRHRSVPELLDQSGKELHHSWAVVECSHVALAGWLDSVLQAKAQHIRGPMLWSVTLNVRTC